MSKLSCCFIFLIIIGCGKKECSNYWVGTHSRFRSDTCYFCQKITVRNDSFILDYNTGNSFSQLFIFNLKDKTKVFYSGGIGSKDIVDNKTHRIVNKGAKVIFRYLDDTTITILGRNYSVYKYQYDEEYTYDASCNYYWMPDFGIIYFGNPVDYYRLQTNDDEENKKIDFAIGAIKDWHLNQDSNTL